MTEIKNSETGNQPTAMTQDAAAVKSGPAEGLQTLDCPVCKGGRFTELFVKGDERFVRCDDCSLVLINPRPAAQRISATYDDAYTAAYIRKAKKKINRCRRWIRRIKRRYVHHGKWLDVGCSAGFVVYAANEAGFDGYGVEIEAAAVKYGTGTLGLRNLVCGLLEEQDYGSGKFDVITLYDVIEHIPDLAGMMTELHRILAPRGIIEVRTPNVSHWTVPKDLSRWKEVKPSEHLYYFDFKTLVKLFNRYGFKIRYNRLMPKSALDVFFEKDTNSFKR
jgi:2-polyprenyl-3-methyl-5-hydroxy-6-metoxy-1,4-benzoquinol methylase